MHDITNVGTGEWLAIGWFTPDYRTLAEKLSLNLAEHAVPYHLFARNKIGNGWDTRQKPTVVLEAMDIYPGKALILMDADCIVGGDVGPATHLGACDVGISTKPRWGRKNRIILTASSRVIVFKPTPGARAFAQEWASLCNKAGPGRDEPSLAWAYISRPEISYAHLNPRYAGLEVGVNAGMDDVVIWHQSAHNEGRWEGPLKWLERKYFRTGRTKAEVRRRAETVAKA